MEGWAELHQRSDGLCGMSGFCVGVNGRRETRSFVLVGGDWKGFSFEEVFMCKGVFMVERVTVCGKVS